MTKNFISKKIIIRLQFSICKISEEAKTDGVGKKAPNFKQIQI